MRAIGRGRRAVFVILVVGLLARLAILWLVPQNARLTTDSTEYAELARGVVSGNGFTRDVSSPFSPYLGRVPAYPLFIAGVWLFGPHSLFAVSVVQSLLDACVSLLVFGMARRRFGVPAGVVAAGLYALLPFTVGTAGQIMSESLCAAFLAGALYAHTRAIEQGKRSLWIVVGALCWVAVILSRPYLAPAAPVAGLILAWENRGSASRVSRSTVLTLCLFGSAFALGLVPWVARNYRVAQQTHASFVPLQLYGSRRPYTTMYTHGFSRFMASFDEPFLWTDTFQAPKAHYSDQVEERRVVELFRTIKANGGVVTPSMNYEFERITTERYRRAPLRLYLWRPLSMMLKMWFSPRAGTLRLSPGTITGVPLPMLIGLALINGTFSILALVGIVRTLRNPSWRSSFPFLVFVPTITTAVLIYVAMRETRVTMPLFPVLCIAAAVGLLGASSWLGVCLQGAAKWRGRQALPRSST